MIALRKYGLPAILALAALLAVGQVNQHLILASDNASYIVLGQALAQGRGYNMINEPLAPAMNLYPLAYPVLLAVVLQLAGGGSCPAARRCPFKMVAVALLPGHVCPCSISSCSGGAVRSWRRWSPCWSRSTPPS